MTGSSRIDESGPESGSHECREAALFFITSSEVSSPSPLYLEAVFGWAQEMKSTDQLTEPHKVVHALLLSVVDWMGTWLIAYDD